jgi:hypothetical protein
MNIDTKKHKLLEILTQQRKDLELKKAEYNALGVPFDKLYNELDCDEDELHSITSELYTSEEIGYHNAFNIVGLFAKVNGVTAFANKKYSNRIVERRKKLVKFRLEILAIFISSASLYFSKFANIDEKQFDKVNKEMQMKIDTLELQVNKLKLKSYNNLNEYENTDSLNVGKK